MNQNVSMLSQANPPPLIVSCLCDVVHDEPGPNVEIAVVHRLQDQPNKGNAQQEDTNTNLRIFL